MKLLPLAALGLALAGCSKTEPSAADATPVAAVAAPAGQDWTQTVAKTDQGYRMGNPDASLKVVEYGSRLCPTCKAFATEGYQPLIKNYVAPGKVSFEYREFLVHGAPDLPPALLGTCGGAAPFFPMLEQMYQHQGEFLDRTQAMTPAQQQQLQAAKPQQAITMLGEQMGLVDFVKQRGLPEAKARACLGDMSRIDTLTKQTQDAQAAGTVTGTPTFLLNGKPMEGVVTWPQMENALKANGA